MEGTERLRLHWERDLSIRRESINPRPLPDAIGPAAPGQGFSRDARGAIGVSFLPFPGSGPTRGVLPVRPLGPCAIPGMDGPRFPPCAPRRGRGEALLLCSASPFARGGPRRPPGRAGAAGPRAGSGFYPAGPSVVQAVVELPRAGAG